jgi:hypothetical protein
MPRQTAKTTRVAEKPPETNFEASPAPREGDLLSLPFDQYGRMRIAQNVMHTLYSAITNQPGGAQGTASRLRVLDVGGYPGVLRHFLSDEYFDLSVLDVAPDDGSIPNYTQGSGMDLPFGDGSFDVVTALDTLEHIPGSDRSRFLSELMRVATHAVVLINPVQSVEADVSEEMLDEYIRWILNAQQEQLAEHRAYGLPDSATTATAFEQSGWQTLAFPAANVHNWLLMMVAKHYLISLRDERASAFERALDRYYNLTFSEVDRTTPAYRGVLVAAKPGLEPALQQIKSAYPPLATSYAANAVRLQLTQVLMTMLDLKTANHEDRLLREQIERRDKHIAGMETRIALQDVELDRKSADVQSLTEQVADRDASLQRIQGYMARLEQEVRNKDEHILYLEKLLQGIEAGRVMRLTRMFSRFLGRS